MVEQAAAVLVGRRQGVRGVRGDGMVSGRGLAVHGCQAAAQRATAFHLHAVRQRHLVFDGVLLVHPCGGGGRGSGVRGHVFWRGRGEAVEVRARVGGGGQGRHWGCPGAATARVSGAGVQAGFAEVADRPCVVVVRRGQSCLPRVQPGKAGAVDKVRSADLVPSEPC